MSEDASPVHVEGTSGALSWALPAPWRKHEPPTDSVELFASMPPMEDAFTPNIVVVAYPYSGDLVDFCRRVVAGVSQDLREGRVVDVNDWAYRSVDPDADGMVEVDQDGIPLTAHPGRVIDYTHATPSGMTVASTDYLFLSGGWAVQVTGTTTIPNRIVFDDVIDSIARSVEALRDPAAADHIDLRSVDSEYATDAVAEEILGAPRERLFETLAAGASIGVGEWLSGAAVARIGELKDRVIGRLGGRNDSVLEELAEHNMFADGRLTDLGEVIAEVMADPELSLRITGRFGSEETMCQVFSQGPIAVVAAERGYAQQVLNQPWHPEDLHRFNVQVLPLGQLTSTLLRWVGAGPAWSVQAIPGLIDPELFEDRLGAEAPLPEDAGEVLEDLWSQPWFTWTMEIEGNTQALDPITYVNAGVRGHHRVGLAEHPDTGREQVVVLPADAGMLLRQIEDHVQAALYGRDVVFA